MILLGLYSIGAVGFKSVLVWDALRVRGIRDLGRSDVIGILVAMLTWPLLAIVYLAVLMNVRIVRLLS